jgi:hypothetical protein
MTESQESPTTDRLADLRKLLPESRKPVVDVFVRRDRARPDSRDLSFQIPSGIEQSDLLDTGFAIDGHSATKSVAAYTDDEEADVSVSDALLAEERHIVKWFSEIGYKVNFQ